MNTYTYIHPELSKLRTFATMMESPNTISAQLRDLNIYETWLTVQLYLYDFSTASQLIS